MAVKITLTLQEVEADALVNADIVGRSGWHSNPSLALQRADFKIMGAIYRARAETKEER